LVTRSTGGQRAIIGGAILVFALLSAYLALVIITRVDSIFFPGNELTLPGAPVLGSIGIDAEGDSGSDEPINILVLGLDRRPREGDTPSRTDTIFIVTVDPKTKSAGLLGIPRDLIVEIPFRSGSGTFQDRINAVYVAGELNGYDQGGIGLMKDVLEAEPFEIDIDHHVIVDFEGFEEIIDALGGIEVDVPEYVYDPYYSETELPGDYLPQEFEEGPQQMDGQAALAYARIRFSTDDLDRIQRQQRVIFAAIEKAKRLNVLSNAEELWNKYKAAIQTDISDLRIAGYALLASQVQDNLVAISLGPATTPYTTREGAAVLIGDPDAVSDIVQSLFSPQPGVAAQPTVAPEPVRVEVQNGTLVDGLASEVVNYIATRGIPIDDLNPANTYDGLAHETTLILDLDGTHERNRLALAGWLDVNPDNARAATPDELALLNGTTADIVVILGDDFDDTVLESAAAGG
jgi:LCP family protein required for cell wall assembly